MAEIQYRIEFFSPWHCGSGMNGGNDADYVPILDRDELPFVPGRTVKGLFREAAEALFDDEFVTRVFGFKDPRDTERDYAGCAVWSNAELPSGVKDAILKGKHTDRLRINRYFIRIDDRGQTADQSLRRGEFIVPMTLTGTIGGIDPDDADRLRECMGFIKRIGLQRSRGFGSCRITSDACNMCSGRTDDIPARKQYFFRCRFLTQVVLNSTGATQGVIDTLEYIPGANFLGIAARDYAKFGNAAFTVFHSGKVRFGTAYPLTADGRPTLPCPASWFIPKGAKLQDGCRIFSTAEEREQNQKELQPKQVRGGFFVAGPAAPEIFGGDVIDKSYSMKSAYDSENRRAENGKLFGYTALPAGSEWYFSLSAADDVSPETLRRIAASLIGRRQIGRSKNAQYGSVEISLLEREPAKVGTAHQGDLYLLYAASPLAFLNEYGEPTPLPRPADLGFPETASLDMRNSQIRRHQYCPWNGVRKSRDAERLAILPGSVIAVRSQTPPDPQVIDRGVGVFLAEGFGRVMVDPDFLRCQKLEAAARPKQKADAPEGIFDLCRRRPAVPASALLKYLENRKMELQVVRAVYAEVENFCGKWSAKRRISASQWGAVRAIAVAEESYGAMMDRLFKKDDEDKSEVDYERFIKNASDAKEHHPGFLRHGKMAEKWGDLADKLERFIQEDFLADPKYKDIAGNPNRKEAAARLFVELFASQMAKAARS